MSDDKKRVVPVLVSLFTYFIMLIGAMALLTDSKVYRSAENLGVCIQLSPFFPLGLGILAGPGSRGLGIALVAISYVSFVAFFVGFVRARSWLRYGSLCLGFAVMLLLNVAGCREMQKGFSSVTILPSKLQQSTHVAIIH